MVWRSIIEALPKQWKVEIRKIGITENLGLKNQEEFTTISGYLVHKNKITSKLIYSDIIKEKFQNPTSQKHISRKLNINIQDIEWTSVYKRVYKYTNNPRLREFQFKILNNYLYLNKDLHRFNIVESSLCTFCKSVTESLEHFFVECKYSKLFFQDINSWLDDSHIKLPILNLENVILGIAENVMQGFLFLLYKYVLYNMRLRNKHPKLCRSPINTSGTFGHG